MEVLPHIFIITFLSYSLSADFTLGMCRIESMLSASDQCWREKVPNSEIDFIAKKVTNSQRLEVFLCVNQLLRCFLFDSVFFLFVFVCLYVVTKILSWRH